MIEFTHNLDGEKPSRKRHIAGLMGVLIGFILVMSIAYLFGGEATGGVVDETVIVENVDLVFNESSVHVLELKEVPRSIYISGSYVGDASAAVYLVIEDERRLIYNTSEDYANLITGFAIVNGTNSTVTNESIETNPQNESMNLSEEINQTINVTETVINNTINDTVSVNVSLNNITNVTGINYTINDSLNETIQNVTEELNISLNISINVSESDQINDTAINVTVGENITDTSINETVNEIGINETNATEINVTIDGNETVNETEQNYAPEWIWQEMEFSITGMTILNLSEFFEDPEEDSLVFITSSAGHVQTELNGELLTIIPQIGFKGESTIIVIASDLESTTSVDLRLIIDTGLRFEDMCGETCSVGDIGKNITLEIIIGEGVLTIDEISYTALAELKLNYTEFNGRTTVEINDYDRIVGFVLEKEGRGMIEWLDPVNISGANIEKYIQIADNLIVVDTERLKGLNVSARLTIEGLQFVEEPVVLVDNGEGFRLCDECTDISYENGVLEFETDHFTSYKAGANSELLVYDSGPVEVFSNAVFYAEYRDILTGEIIENADCQIFENNMTYDDVYVYNGVFELPGVREYGVSCNREGYESLSVVGEINITLPDLGDAFVEGRRGSKLTCSVRQRNDCNGTEVLYMSDLTNAHAELSDQDNYDYSVCCYDNSSVADITVSSDGYNFVSLFSATNSHVELPTEMNYQEKAYLDTSSLLFEIDCWYPKTSGVCADQNQSCLMTLSTNDKGSDSNLHVASCENSVYETSVCCAFVEDIHPVASQLRITPDSPTYQNTSIAAEWFFFDAEGEMQNRTTYRWYRNGTEAQLNENVVLLMHFDQSVYDVANVTNVEEQGVGYTSDVEGRVMWGATFNGSQYINGTIQTITDEIVLMTWVRTSSVERQSLISKDDSVNRAYSLGTDNGNAFFEVFVGDVSKNVTGVNISDDEWHHIAGVYNGSEIRLYVDGDLSASVAQTGSIDSDSTSLEVGRKGDSSQYYNGTMDELVVYNKSVTAEEVHDDYMLMFNGRVEGGLLFLHHFDHMGSYEVEEPLENVSLTFENGLYGTKALFVNETDSMIFNASKNFKSVKGTIELWIKPRWSGADTDAHMFVEVLQRGSSSTNVQFGKGINGADSQSLVIDLSDGSVQTVYDVSGWSANEWHHIAAVWNSSVTKIYVDGSERVSGVGAVLSEFTNANMTLGMNIDAGDQADALLEEMAVYDHVRSGKQINDSYRRRFSQFGLNQNITFDRFNRFKFEIIPSDGRQLGEGINSTEREIINRAPTLLFNITNQTFREDTNNTKIVLSEYFIDYDHDPVTYNASHIENVTVIINQTDGNVTLWPDFDFSGNRSVVFYARDQFGGVTASNNLSLEIIDVTDIPMPSNFSVQDGVTRWDNSSLDTHDSTPHLMWNEGNFTLPVDTIICIGTSMSNVQNNICLYSNRTDMPEIYSVQNLTHVGANITYYVKMTPIDDTNRVGEVFFGNLTINNSIPFATGTLLFDTHNQTPTINWSIVDLDDGSDDHWPSDEVVSVLLVGNDSSDRAYYENNSADPNGTVVRPAIPWGLAGGEWANRTVSMTIYATDGNNDGRSNNHTGIFVLHDYLPRVDTVEMSNIGGGYGVCSPAGSGCAISPLEGLNATLDIRVNITEKDQDCDSSTHTVRMIMCINTSASVGCDEHTNANYTYEVVGLESLGERCVFNLSVTSGTPEFFRKPGDYQFYVNATSQSYERTNTSDREGFWVYSPLKAINYSSAVQVGAEAVKRGIWNDGAFKYVLKNFGNEILDLYWNITNPVSPRDVWRVNGTDFQIDDDNSYSVSTGLTGVYLNNTQKLFGYGSGLSRCIESDCANGINETMDTYYHIMPPINLTAGLYNSTIYIELRSH